VYYKCVSAFLKENELFRKFSITGDVQNVYLLLLSNIVLKNGGPTIHVAVMAHHIPNL
jgi:hypothetical protein